jgi:hypothetical protein
VDLFQRGLPEDEVVRDQVRKKEGAQAGALKKIAIAAIREVPGLSV